MYPMSVRTGTAGLTRQGVKGPQLVGRARATRARALPIRSAWARSLGTMSRKRLACQAEAAAQSEGTQALAKLGTQMAGSMLKAASRAAQGPVFVAGACQGGDRESDIAGAVTLHAVAPRGQAWPVQCGAVRARGGGGGAAGGERSAGRGICLPYMLQTLVPVAPCAQQLSRDSLCIP